MSPGPTVVQQTSVPYQCLSELCFALMYLEMLSCCTRGQVFQTALYHILTTFLLILGSELLNVRQFVYLRSQDLLS